MDPQDDERVEELGSLTAIFPELQFHNDDPFSATLELAVSPATPLLVRFLPSQSPRDASFADVATNAPVVERDVELSHLPPLVIHMNLPAQYPNDQPPRVQLATQFDWLPREKISELEVEVIKLWEEYGHCQILFSYIDSLQQAAERGFDLAESAEGCLVLPSVQESRLKAFAEQTKQESFDAGTYDCGVCLEPKKGYACYSMARCGHVFCKECLQDFYVGAITEGNVKGVQCMDPDCGAEDMNVQQRRSKKVLLVQPRELLAMGVEERLVRRYVDLKRKKKIEADKNTVYCPRVWCQAPARNDKYPPLPSNLNTYVDADMVSGDESEPEPEEEEAPQTNTDKPLRSPNSEKLTVCEKCEFAFCKVCYRSWHGPYVRCHPRNPNELSEEEKASYEYLRLNTSECPSCAAPVSKSEGCNHMQCFNCNTHFCYLCGAYLLQDNPYLHFNTPRTECYQRLFELDGGDEGQGPEDGRGFGGLRHIEAMAIEAAREADAAEARAAARAEAEAAEWGPRRHHLPVMPPDQDNEPPLIVAMAQAQLGLDDLSDEEEPPVRNVQRQPPQPAAVRRPRNPFPRNPPARGAAHAVRNHERGAIRRRQGGGGGNRQELEQRQQAELQRFLALAERDEEEGWDSDDFGDDDEFVIPRR